MASSLTQTSLSEDSIRSLIRLRGSLPSDHRVTAWKYLLRLPGNSRAFHELLSRGPEPTVVANLASRYPVRNRKLFRKTVVLMSALAHWSPIWAEVEFAIPWTFPFVLLFGQDDLGAFEAAMSFLLHWGSRMLVTFPQPPVPILVGMELALRRVDRELSAHLKSLSMGALCYGWPLLQSAFSEVLARDEWLRLMDRVFSSVDRPELLEAAAVAFVVASRVWLLACRSTAEAQAFFRRPQPSVDIGEMLRVMEKVCRFGSPERWSRGRVDVDGTMAALAVLRLAPRKFEPLAAGVYPHFDGYPQFVVNYQADLREMVAKQEKDKERKRRLVR
ncbi:unnamed protein product, partial [Ascophyllum nodosum]